MELKIKVLRNTIVPFFFETRVYHKGEELTIEYSKEVEDRMKILPKNFEYEVIGEIKKPKGKKTKAKETEELTLNLED